MWPREKILQIADKVSLPKVTEVLPSGCAVCGKDATRLCSHCKAISYCGEDHENANYNKHGFICKAIDKQRLESSDEAEAWLYDSEDEDGRVPEEMVPLSDHLLLQRIHSVDSVRAQIKYYDTLNCTWFDPRFEIECGVLPLLARVNQDQKMYDLIKGLFIHKVIGVKVKGADVLECMDFYHDSRSGRERGIVELVLNLALLKAKLLLDMQRIHAAMEVLSQRLPREIVDIVLPGIPQSPTMAIRPTKMSARDVSTEIKNLKGQFNCLYTDVNRLNRHIWLKLASHKLKDSVIEPHQMKGRHSCEMYENQRIFKRQVYAWFETPGAIALIQGKCRSEKKGSQPDSASHVPYMSIMSSISFGDANHGTQLAQNYGTIHYFNRPETPPEPLSTVPFRRDPDFVENEEILNQIRWKGELPGSRIALVGLGGVGKTQIAIEYCYRVREASPDTWAIWINASNATRFEQGCRDFADQVRLPGSRNPNANIIKLLSEWLHGSERRWILVLDNVNEDEFLHDIPEASMRTIWEQLDWLHNPKGQVLITSRNRHVVLRLVREVDILLVEPMSVFRAMKLLANKIPGPKEEEGDMMVRLVRELGGLPLAIVSAAAYIKGRAPRISIKKYLELYQNSDRRKISFLDSTGGDGRRDRDDAPVSIEYTWLMSFEHIRTERPSAMDLLYFMSFFSGDGIPDKLVKEGARTNYKYTNGATPGMVEPTKEYSYEPSFGSDESENETKESQDFEDDVYMLKAYSFLSISSDGRQFQVHRLVQLATQRWLRTSGEHEAWKGHFIHSLYINFPPGTFENWTACGMLVTHVQCAISQRPTKKQGTEEWPDGGVSLKEWASLLHEAAYFAWATGVAKDSRLMAQKAMKARTELLGLDNMYTLSSVEILALALSLEGKWKAAEELHDQVLEVCQRILPPEHPNTMMVMGNLASTYRNQGRWKEAELLELQVVQHRQKTLGPRHFDTLTSMANLSSTYRYQGRWKEAEELDVQVMEARKQDLGLNHPVTLTSMANLALTYWNQGRGKESEELGVQVVNARRQVLGPEHPLTLNSMANLASTYWNQERWEEAEELGSQVLEARKRLLGDEHPETLNSMANLASTYGDQGRLEEAEELEVYVLETRKRVLGLKHPDTLTSMANLASTYGDQGRWKEAEDLEFQVVEISKRVLGLEHPDTLTGMANLASTYKDQNRWKEAKELEMQVMETRKQVLGFEHPDTISSMMSLAHTLRSSGRNEVD